MSVGTGCRNSSEYTFPSSLLFVITLGVGTGAGTGSGGVQSTNPKQYIPGPHSSSFADGHGALHLS